MKTKYKYLHFTEEPPLPKRKTSEWRCSNHTNDDFLGTVFWYVPWRQYCFQIEGEIILNKGCLDDVADFIKQLMDARK